MSTNITTDTNPRPCSSEWELLVKILESVNAGAGGGGSGHFDSQGNIQVYDSVNGIWRSLTAPNGILTVN